MQVQWSRSLCSHFKLVHFLQRFGKQYISVHNTDRNNSENAYFHFWTPVRWPYWILKNGRIVWRNHNIPAPEWHGMTILEVEPTLHFVRNSVFTAQCTLVQSAVLRSHVVCPSVRPSVTLVNCDHIGWNSSKIISLSNGLGCSLFATQTSRVYSKGNTLEFSPE